MFGYNSARTIPTKISLLYNKYIANFHEIQYKYLEAVTGQTTKYLKFRMVGPRTSSNGEDTLMISLPSNSGSQAFIPPSGTSTQLIGQLLPVYGLNTDNDYSVGMLARG